MFGRSNGCAPDNELDAKRSSGRKFGPVVLSRRVSSSIQSVASSIEEEAAELKKNYPKLSNSVSPKKFHSSCCVFVNTYQCIDACFYIQIGFRRRPSNMCLPGNAKRRQSRVYCFYAKWVVVDKRTVIESIYRFGYSRGIFTKTSYAYENEK